MTSLAGDAVAAWCACGLSGVDSEHRRAGWEQHAAGYGGPGQPF